MTPVEVTKGQKNCSFNNQAAFGLPNNRENIPCRISAIKLRALNEKVARTEGCCLKETQTSQRLYQVKQVCISQAYHLVALRKIETKKWIISVVINDILHGARGTGMV